MSSPIISVLNMQEIDQIKMATLDLLENVGIIISYQPALDTLRRAGARIEGERVYFPTKMVEDAIAKVPRCFEIHGRNPEKNVTVGDGSMVMAPGYGAPFITDSSGVKRNATLKDFQNLAILSGASPNMNVSGGPLVEPCDVDDSIRHKVMLYHCMAASDKPFMGSATGAEHAQDSLEMAAILFGGKEAITNRPVMITLINSLTPLAFDERMAGALMVHAAASQPVIITSLGMAGSTTPTTLASTLVIQNAEVLAGITLGQTVREGTPVVYGSASSITEMRSGSLSIGCPEGAWIIAAAAQIAHSYGMPCRGGGCLTDSKIPDAQAAWESMMNLQMAGLANVDFVLHSAGILESYMSMSLEKFVMDDEICSVVRRIQRGTEINTETLALDLIREVGPGGEFLTAEHTFKHFRKELWQAQLSDRNNYDVWRLEGSKDTFQRAKARVQEILTTYTKPPIEESIDRTLRNFAGLT